MVRQVALLPAGCQPWNRNVVASSGQHFAYSATLAIYIYKMDRVHKEHRLISIMSEHKKTITSICWCPEKPNHLASSSADGLVIVWDITTQRPVAKLTHKEPVLCID
ncbi:WD repeat-containing protein 17, partial [Aplysia californica]|uniref:WD repeat-containing protein 17 n=1 Tax=Aplysia californica TaxID=6500 RepID=A0ABM1AE63_APLCA